MSEFSSDGFNMIWKKGEFIFEDVCLRTVSIEDLSLMRDFRNQSFVRRNLVSKGIVSLEGQKKWFQRLDRDSSAYFIASFRGVDFGVFSISKLDRKNRSCFSGGFVGKKAYLSHPASFKVACLLVSIAFSIGGVSKIYCDILRENKGAIRFNEKIGYKIVESDSGCELLRYALDGKESYFGFSRES